MHTETIWTFCVREPETKRQGLKESALITVCGAFPCCITYTQIHILFNSCGIYFLRLFCYNNERVGEKVR